MQPELVDAAGASVPYLDGRWLVEENQRYELRVPERCEARIEERPLTWEPAVRGFVLKLPMAAGAYRLELLEGVHRSVFPIEVEPSATKLSPANWEAMLSDLDGWLPGLLAGAEGATSGSVSTAGVASPLAAVALIPLLSLLERAVRTVIERPRTVDIAFLEDVPLHQTRRATRESLAWLSRHPTASAWLDVENEERLVGPPPLIPQRVVEDTHDHPANRYVAWLIGRVCHRLREVASDLESVKHSELMDTRAWARPRARALRRGAYRLDRLVKRSFLGELTPRPATEAALLVVQDHPAYARVHRLGRRFLSALFTLDGDGPSAPTRPSFELYELWTFLATWRSLDDELPGLTWKATGMRKLLALTPGTGGARIATEWGGGELAIDFNPTFGSLLGGVPAHGRWSLSRERRPDVTVSFQHTAHGAWVCLDAKYRVGASNLGDALGKAHIYRDALRWDSLGGACRASALLAPKRTKDCSLWFERGFLDTHGVGVWELRPGTPPPGDYAAWLLEALAREKESK